MTVLRGEQCEYVSSSVPWQTDRISYDAFHSWLLSEYLVKMSMSVMNKSPLRQQDLPCIRVGFCNLVLRQKKFGLASCQGASMRFIPA